LGERAANLICQNEWTNGDLLHVHLLAISHIQFSSLYQRSEPHALTMCNADLPLARSNERRKTLPSMATTPSNCSENCAMKRWNESGN
jgi:hypothetical protein